jgi:hypothetical protein
MVRGVGLMHEASGNKAAADQLKAVAAEIDAMKEPKADTLSKSLDAVEKNPVDRASLTKVKTADGQKLLVQSSAYVAVASLYNVKAVDSAKKLSSTTPTPMDAVQAPSLLEAAKVAVTSLPAQAGHLTQYGSRLGSYMSENKIQPPTSEQKVAIAKATDPGAANNAANY